MEIKVGDDGNSNSNTPSLHSSFYSILPNQQINGTSSNFRQRSEIMVRGAFDVNTEAFLAKELAKRKIKEEFLTYGYFKSHRELENEILKELERELMMRRTDGIHLINAPFVSSQLECTSNCLDERLALVNQQHNGEINARISLVNRTGNGINGDMPYENCLDDHLDGSLSLRKTPDQNRSKGLPFQRHPGFTCGVSSKPIIDLRKPVPLPKATSSDASSGLKRKLETKTEDTDDTLPDSKSKKSQRMWSCDLCQLRLNSEQMLKEHQNGKKHKAKEKAVQKTTPITTSIPCVGDTSLSDTGTSK